MNGDPEAEFCWTLGVLAPFWVNGVTASPQKKLYLARLQRPPVGICARRRLSWVIVATYVAKNKADI